MTYKIDWPTRGHRFVASDIEDLPSLILSDSELTNGSNVTAFEDEFCSAFGLGTCLATMSCAHALDIVALFVAQQSGPNFEVLIPSHTYCATAIAFGRVGATIRWTDIDPDTFTNSFASIKANATIKTKAIVLVHLYGLITPEIKEIRSFCDERNIILIEDCAQSVGAHINGVYAGALGDFSTFSFHAQKNMTTLGEGGMLALKNPNLREKFMGLRLNGHHPYKASQKTNYWLPAMVNVDQDLKDYWPTKSTLTESQANVGRKLLLRLKKMNHVRKELAVSFCKKLSDVSELQFQKYLSLPIHANHLLPARITSEKFSRDQFIKVISSKYGIKCIVQYFPLHRYDLFEKKGFGNSHLPKTDHYFNNMISFPFWEGLKIEEIDYMAESARAVVDELNQ